MGFIHYTNKGPSREKLLRGEVPKWIANSKRRKYITQVVLSTPPWVDRTELWKLHARAQERTVMTGVPHCLDHIVPLNHPNICGLTVPWNLRVSPLRCNLVKGNKWHPDQMELFECLD